MKILSCVAACLIALSVACGGKTAPSVTPDPVAGVGADTLAHAAGTECVSNDQCQSGICEGQGCGDDMPGVCVEATRGCTRDLQTYCGCDGETFQASGSCPGKRYSEREACAAE